jgi:hypothetical protein
VPTLTLDAMFTLIGPLLRLLIAPANLRDLAPESLAFRQQLAVFKRKGPRPRLRGMDCFSWVWLSRTGKGWQRACRRNSSTSPRTSRNGDHATERRAETTVFGRPFLRRMHHYRVLAKDR